MGRHCGAFGYLEIKYDPVLDLMESKYCGVGRGDIYYSEVRVALDVLEFLAPNNRNDFG